MKILKSIVAVIAAYIAMALIVIIGYNLVYLAVGTEGAFKPASYEASGLWIALTIPVGIVAAVFGGWLCKAIAKSRGAVIGLIVVIAVLGALGVVGQALAPVDDSPREGDVSAFDAASKARQPIWVAVLNPVIGVAGVAFGGGLIRTKKPETA